MRRYTPGKGLDEEPRPPGKPRSTRIKVGTPPKGRQSRIGVLPDTGEVAVSSGRKVLRRKFYQT